MPSIRTPDFKLTIGTVNFSEQPLKQRVSEINVELLSDGASSFKIVLDDCDDMFTNGKSDIREGMSCKISLGYADPDASVDPVIEGIVTGIEPKRKEYLRKLYIIKGFDGMSLLTRGRKRRCWEKIKDSDLASKIANECGLQPDVEDSRIIHPYVVQNNETNMAFLFGRAKRIGYEVKVEGKKLVFKKPRNIDSGVILRWDGMNVQKHGGALLQKLDFETSTMNMPKKVIVRSYDPSTSKPIIGTATRISGDSMGGKKSAADAAASNNPDTTIQISDEMVVSQEEADLLAQSILDQRAGEFLTGKGKCYGDGKLKCGYKVKIEDVGRGLDGEYYITGAKHEFKAGHGQGFGYWTEFSVSRTGH